MSAMMPHFLAFEPAMSHLPACAFNPNEHCAAIPDLLTDRDETFGSILLMAHSYG